MKTKLWILDHPLRSYFLGAYGITWTGILVFLAARGFRTDDLGLSDILIMFFMMLLGPGLSGVGLNVVLDGRRGLGELFGRMLVWRVRPFWYAVVLLTNPILTLAILGWLTLMVSPAFAPGFMGLGIVAGLLAGFVEELGWTGFALPNLLKKHNALTAGLILGVLWALWHSLADYVGNISTMGSSWLPHFLVYWLLPLTAYRILMTWVYANTRSLLLAQLMHMSYTGWQAILVPATTLEYAIQWQAIFAATLWLVVTIVVVRHGTRLVREPGVRFARPI